jgi:hypothetical protein
LYRELAASADRSFNLLTSLAKDDTLDFVVTVGTSGGSGGTTPLDVSILLDPTCQDVGIYRDTDFNKDCYVDLDDFAVIAQSWLWCNDPLNSECD